MELQTGDIVLTSKDSIIARFMRFFQKDPVIWGHCLVVRDNECGWEASLKLIECDVQEKLKKAKAYKIIRKVDLTGNQQLVMRYEAPRLLGNGYSYWRIFLQMLDQFFDTDWFTSREEKETAQVCSSYAAWIYWRACRYEFNNVGWASCEPDDIEDDTILYPERWIVIAEKGIDKLRRLKRNG